jgi:hypothetical protein
MTDKPEEKEEYSLIRVPFELFDYQVDFIRENNLEERFNQYWKDWQKMLEARGVDK